MRLVTIDEAKAHLDTLIDAAAAGEEIVFVRSGEPVATLSALFPTATRRRGVLAGQIKIAADFDAALPEDVLRDFESR